MSINNKRKTLLDDFNNVLKKFKIGTDSDSDSCDDLRIDLNFSQTPIETSKRPLDYDCVSVTTSSGRRVYVKTRDNDADHNDIIPPVIRPQTASANYYRLLDEIERDARTKRMMIQEEEVVVNASEGGLWADKYSPQKYMELLSDEGVNRGMLTWIKLWDKTVFGREAFPVVGEVEEGLRVSEEDGRPSKKAILLTGPPGIGKTTLAVVIAKHCGYRVEHMNASNERNPEEFQQKIECVNTTADWCTTSKSRSSPSCLIVDEIDGTTSAAIAVLTAAINAPLRRQLKEASAHKRNKDSKSKLCIRRPVICICNDLYATSLKTLRPLCHIVRVSMPDYSQMLYRLGDVCALEGLLCDRAVLTHLIDVTNRDIRSCLNTLQFLKQKGRTNVTVVDLDSINIGNKDVHSGIFRVWEEIFTETSVKRSFLGGEGEGAVTESARRCGHVMRLVQATGDLDKVIAGIHENYLSLVKFKDIRLREMVACTDWLVFCDLTSQKAAATQQYSLARYRPFLAPFFHLSFASAQTASQRILWPSADASAHFSRQKMAAILAGVSATAPWPLEGRELLLQLLPALSRILRPSSVRPVSSQLHSGQERALMTAVVALMRAAGLNYVQERIADLGCQFVLQPNIDLLVEMPSPEATRTSLPQSLKQLIGGEVRAARLRQRAPLEPPSVPLAPQIAPQVVPQAQRRAGHFSFMQYRAGDRQKPSGGGLVTKEAPMTTLLRATASFRYNQGCTDAVRRAVRLRDL